MEHYLESVNSDIIELSEYVSLKVSNTINYID